MVGSDRTVEPISRKGVQQFNGKIELLGFSQRGLRILRVLGTPDCTASDAAKVVGCSKSLVSHWKDHAIKVGALRLLTDGIVKYYELTPFGSKILASSINFTTGEGVSVGFVHVLEDHAVKFEILKEEDSERRIDWLGNVRVVKTPRHIIIQPGKLRDFDANQLLVTAGQIVGRVRLELMVRFGMILSEEVLLCMILFGRFLLLKLKSLRALEPLRFTCEMGLLAVWIVVRLIVKGILSTTERS